MAEAAPLAVGISADDAIFEQLERYAWDQDHDFQAGLASILNAGDSEEQRRDITARAKCFYFSRKFDVPIDPSRYVEWLAAGRGAGEHSTVDVNGVPGQTTSSSAAQTEISTSEVEERPPQQAPYPTSFAHIVNLISTGQPVPGIKEIPSTILEGRSSENSAQARRKPWERSETTATITAPRS